MWVEIFNIEKCCSVDEPAENSTVIPERPGKGAGTHRQARRQTRSISRETAIAMLFPRDQHIAFAVSRLNVHFQTSFPEAKASGYPLPPLRGKIKTIVVPLNLVAIRNS
jgi:hypothetical protein